MGIAAHTPERDREERETDEPTASHPSLPTIEENIYPYHGASKDD